MLVTINITNNLAALDKQSLEILIDLLLLLTDDSTYQNIYRYQLTQTRKRKLAKHINSKSLN